MTEMDKSAKEIAHALRTDPSYARFSKNPRWHRAEDVLNSAEKIMSFIPLDWREFVVRAIPGLSLREYRRRQATKSKSTRVNK